MSILKLTSDTLSSPAAVGQIEYNGTVFAATPASTQRGIVPTEQFFALNSGLAGANATGAQNILGVGVTLAGSTVYEFELNMVLLKSAGTTSHNFSFGFGGTATLNSILYNVADTGNSSQIPATGNATWSGGSVSVATATALLTAMTSATNYINMIIKGTVSINAGGTFIPQYTLSAAPGGAYTTQAGSYMKIKPLAASGANVNVGTWA